MHRAKGETNLDLGSLGTQKWRVDGRVILSSLQIGFDVLCHF